MENELKETKQTMGTTIDKLLKRVQKMEDVMKATGVVFSDTEGDAVENSSKQRWNLDEQELQTLTKEKLPQNSKVSHEGMEAADILINNLSQSKQKKLLKKKVVTEEVEVIKTGNDLVKSTAEVKSVSETETATRREGKEKQIMVEGAPQPKKTMR